MKDHKSLLQIQFFPTQQLLSANMSVFVGNGQIYQEQMGQVLYDYNLVEY